MAEAGLLEYHACILTSKGKVALDNHSLLLEEVAMSNNEYNFHAPVGSVNNQGTQSNVAGEVKGKQVINDYSITIDKNIDDIERLITLLRENIQHFPEIQREEAAIELDDLEEYIQNPEKHNPKRFAKRLKGLLAAGTIAVTIASTAAEDLKKFSDNVEKLVKKLEVPIEFIKARFDD